MTEEEGRMLAEPARKRVTQVVDEFDADCHAAVSVTGTLAVVRILGGWRRGTNVVTK